MTEPDLNFSDIADMSNAKMRELADELDMDAQKYTALAVEHTEAAKALRERAK